MSLSVFDTLAKDLTAKPLICCAERRHGKSSTIRTFSAYLRNKGFRLKVFDPSLAWFKSSTNFKIRVTKADFEAEAVPNINDCTYLIGELTHNERKAFISKIVGKDLKDRYERKVTGDSLDSQPWICYIIEESETVIGTHSLRGDSLEVSTWLDLLTMGRNFKTTAVFLGTRLAEMSTSAVERSNYMLGAQQGDNNLRKIERIHWELREGLQTIQRYEFLYFNGKVSTAFKVPDTVDKVPVDYTVKVLQPQPQVSHLKLFVVKTLFALYILHLLNSFF